MQSVFDSAWHDKALAGEADAVSLLAGLAIGPVYRFCYYRLGRDEHLCQDVVQETMLRAISRLDQYDPRRSGGDIFGWLIGLARNEIRRVLSRSPSSQDLQDMWNRMDRELLSLYGMLDSEPFEDDLIGRRETREMVNTTMSQLPPHYGGALEAKYMLGQSVRQIAAALGQTEKAIESLLTRARKAFKTTFLKLSVVSCQLSATTNDNDQCSMLNNQ